MEVVRFSPSGEYLAVSGSDGHLRLWETATNKLWHEFIPSSHLAATCTCLEWAPTYQENGQKGKKKKRKRAVEGDVLVLGTAVGSLLFYDVAKSQLVKQSSKTSPGNVNALTWSPSTLLIYTCGADGIIREWDPETAKVNSQWTASKENLTAIQTINSQLLVGGQTITLWNLNTKKSIASFIGHPGQIAQIIVVPSTDYFVSMAQGDRSLKIWQTGHTQAVASLAVPEPPSNVNVFTCGNGVANVAVANRKGHLHIFQQKLNGQVKKPLTPTATITVVDSNSADQEIVPVLSGHVSDQINVSILAAYGNWLKLRFERFEVSGVSKDHVVSREFSHLKSKKSKKSSSKSQETQEEHMEVPNDVKHLMPGTETLNQIPGSSKSKKQGGKEKVGKGDLPMEERLTNLTIDAPVRNELPQGENLGHLLSQGLHSKDTRILQSVLHRNDEKVILNTVRSLPVQLILPLVEEIKVMLTGKSQVNHCILRWLKAVFQIHSSYLMCCSANEELMGPIMSLLRARETLYPQMCLLKGKLELIKGHVAAKQYKADVPNEALLTYQDESSDDDEKQEDGLLPSESEEFLTSDDLDPDNSGSEEENKGEDSDSVEGNSEDDDEDGIDPKLNGKGAGSDESMDED
ncbi:unnamed protein product [Allacma fusca]|uniref:WD repeat-containing protein 43 n=1 Tax=Allacma fusca TaxID=39272 RepID=A0A8J2PRS6_9HEXA|nr:unnamed protein product [Allacma fusca]